MKPSALALAAVITCAFTGTAVPRDARAATVVDKETFQGTQAAGSFSAESAITCADGSAGTASVSGFLSGSDFISRTKGSPSTLSKGVFVEIDGYSNTCTGTTFGFGDGGIAGGYAAPDKKLDSAGIEGTASVQDFSSGNTLSVGLSIVFVGTGPITASKSHSRTTTGGGPGGPITMTISQSANSNRSAIPSGTITIEGVAFDPDFSFATLSANGSTTITITRN